MQPEELLAVVKSRRAPRAGSLFGNQLRIVWSLELEPVLEQLFDFLTSSKIFPNDASRDWNSQQKLRQGQGERCDLEDIPEPLPVDKRGGI